MKFDNDYVRPVVEELEDRLSKLPDEVIHKILSCFDMKFIVQTCLLSSRWKLVWTSMPCLNFSSGQFPGDLCKFGEFVTNVLYHHKDQIQVSSIKLHFNREVCKVVASKIANYAFSHNVQQLEVACWLYYYEFPPCVFSSQSLKHFTLHNCYISRRTTPTTPWDFPALTTLHLSLIILCQSGDIFSKCVNLKNLKLDNFELKGVLEVLDIITPRLSNLILIEGKKLKVVNVIAPQLENLTIIDTRIEYLNAPAGVSSFCYKGYDPPLQLSKDRFHSLNQVNIRLSLHSDYFGSYKKDARKIINILQELHCAKYLTLNKDIIKCISSFPDLLSHHPSPFSNLICLSIDSENAYKFKMGSEARNFLFENSPNATFTLYLPEEPPHPIHGFRYKRKYTFTATSTANAAIVDDTVFLKKKNMKKQINRGKKRKLSRLDAVMVIQMCFRAYLNRRYKDLRILCSLAVAKGELKDLSECRSRRKYHYGTDGFEF